MEISAGVDRRGDTGDDRRAGSQAGDGPRERGARIGLREGRELLP
jgi:hypothetical protein